MIKTLLQYLVAEVAIAALFHNLERNLATSPARNASSLFGIRKETFVVLTLKPELDDEVVLGRWVSFDGENIELSVPSDTVGSFINLYYGLDEVVMLEVSGVSERELEGVLNGIA